MRWIVASGTVLAMGFAAPALGQAGPPLQPGEIIENGGGGQQIKIIQCYPTQYRWRECDSVAWKNGRADSNVARWNEEDLIKSDARVRAALGMKPRGGARAAAAPAARPVARPGAPVVARPASVGGRVPNGTYKCQIWMGGSYVSLGTVRSVNGSLETGLLNKVGATFTGAAANADGVTINYKTARGYNESMDCKRQ